MPAQPTPQHGPVPAPGPAPAGGPSAAGPAGGGSTLMLRSPGIPYAGQLMASGRNQQANPYQAIVQQITQQQPGDATALAQQRAMEAQGKLAGDKGAFVVAARFAKSSWQDNEGPRTSATGEATNVGFEERLDDYAQGQAAWASAGKYLKKPPKETVNPFIGKHAGELKKTAGPLSAIGKGLSMAGRLFTKAKPAVGMAPAAGRELAPWVKWLPSAVSGTGMTAYERSQGQPWDVALARGGIAAGATSPTFAKWFAENPLGASRLGAVGAKGLVWQGYPALKAAPDYLKARFGDVAKTTESVGRLTSELAGGGYTGTDPQTGQQFEMDPQQLAEWQKLHPLPEQPKLTPDVLARLQVQKQPGLGESLSTGLGRASAGLGQAGEAVGKDLPALTSSLSSTAQKVDKSISNLDKVFRPGNELADEMTGMLRTIKKYAPAAAITAGSVAVIYALSKAYKAFKPKPSYARRTSRPRPAVRLKEPGTYTINYPDDEDEDKGDSQQKAADTELASKLSSQAAFLGELAARPAQKRGKDQIPGGKADNKKPSDFPAKSLHKGVEDELEHTNKPSLAREIAMDHLVESPRYYTELDKMEDKLESDKSANVGGGDLGGGTVSGIDDVTKVKPTQSVTGPVDPPVIANTPRIDWSGRIEKMKMHRKDKLKMAADLMAEAIRRGWIGDPNQAPTTGQMAGPAQAAAPAAPAAPAATAPLPPSAPTMPDVTGDQRIGHAKTARKYQKVKVRRVKRSELGGYSDEQIQQAVEQLMQGARSPIVGHTLGALSSAGAGAYLGALPGLIAGHARGNSPEGLGRGIFRGGAAGLGAYGGLQAANMMTQNPWLRALGALGGGVGGYMGSGMLMGKPSGRAKMSAERAEDPFAAGFMCNCRKAGWDNTRIKAAVDKLAETFTDEVTGPLYAALEKDAGFGKALFEKTIKPIGSRVIRRVGGMFGRGGAEALAGGAARGGAEAAFGGVGRSVGREAIDAVAGGAARRGAGMAGRTGVEYAINPAMRAANRAGMGAARAGAEAAGAGAARAGMGGGPAIDYTRMATETAKKMRGGLVHRGLAGAGLAGGAVLLPVIGHQAYQAATTPSIPELMSQMKDDIMRDERVAVPLRKTRNFVENLEPELDELRSLRQDARQSLGQAQELIGQGRSAMGGAAKAMQGFEQLDGFLNNIFEPMGMGDAPIWQKLILLLGGGSLLAGVLGKATGAGGMAAGGGLAVLAGLLIPLIMKHQQKQQQQTGADQSGSAGSMEFPDTNRLLSVPGIPYSNAGAPPFDMSNTNAMLSA